MTPPESPAEQHPQDNPDVPAEDEKVATPIIDSEPVASRIRKPSAKPRHSEVSKIIKDNKGKILLACAGILVVYAGIKTVPSLYRKSQDKEKAHVERVKEEKEREQTPNPSIGRLLNPHFKDGEIIVENLPKKDSEYKIDECGKLHRLTDVQQGEMQIEGGGEFTVPVTLIFEGHEKQTVQYTATIWVNRDNPTISEINFILNNQSR